MAKKSNGVMKIFLAVFIGCVLSFLAGTSFPVHHLFQQLNTISRPSHVEGKVKCSLDQVHGDDLSPSSTSTNISDQIQNTTGPFKICEPSNPRGAERLPPLIIANESDFYLYRLWGNPKDDLPNKPKYLVTFTVGYNQKNIINAAVKKFSDNFTVLLFHYDGRTNEWDEFEWSKRAIHVSVPRQAKWWYAKRFLHPDIVAAYDYIFIWDEDLGVEHFDSEEYIKIIKKHGLEISQPAVEPMRGLTWRMTMKRYDREVHKWMAATLIDFYINIFAIGAWIVYKESNWIRGLIWIVLLVCFGSIATCAYIVLQLVHLSPQESSQNPIYFVLLGQKDKGGGERKRIFTALIGRVVFGALGCLMLGSLVYTIATDGSPFRKELLTPWLSATLVDFYVNVIALSVWVAYKESSWIASASWIVLLICFGSITTCAYIVLQLFSLSSQDPASLVLFSSTNRTERGYERTNPEESSPRGW